MNGFQVTGRGSSPQGEHALQKKKFFNSLRCGSSWLPVPHKDLDPQIQLNLDPFWI
jgi:hypothetical protein